MKIKLFLNAKNIVTKKFQNRDVAVSVRKSWCGLFQYKGKLITSNLERTSNTNRNPQGTSPPPPYDPPPPYTVAILMEGQEQLSLSPPITV